MNNKWKERDENRDKEKHLDVILALDPATPEIRTASLDNECSLTLKSVELSI
jgi:hypothetical protein